MKKVYISKYRSESATSDLPKQHDMEQDYRLAVLSAAIRAGEASGEAIEKSNDRSSYVGRLLEISRNLEFCKSLHLGLNIYPVPE